MDAIGNDGYPKKGIMTIWWTLGVLLCLGLGGIGTVLVCPGWQSQLKSMGQMTRGDDVPLSLVLLHCILTRWKLG